MSNYITIKNQTVLKRAIDHRSLILGHVAEKNGIILNSGEKSILKIIYLGMELLNQPLLARVSSISN